VVFFYLELVALQALLHFMHVILVGVDELYLLPFEHVVDFVLQPIGKGVELFD